MLLTTNLHWTNNVQIFRLLHPVYNPIDYIRSGWKDSIERNSSFPKRILFTRNFTFKSKGITPSRIFNLPFYLQSRFTFVSNKYRWKTNRRRIIGDELNPADHQTVLFFFSPFSFFSFDPTKRIRSKVE